MVHPHQLPMCTHRRLVRPAGPSALPSHFPRVRDHVEELHIRFSWFDGVPTPVADLDPDSNPVFMITLDVPAMFDAARADDTRRTVVTTPAELADIVDTLGTLQRLELHDVSLSTQLSSSPGRVVQAARDLATLCLHAPGGEIGWEPLSRFLQHFGHIRRLALNVVQCLPTQAPEVPTIRVSGHLPSVDVLQFDQGSCRSAHWFVAFSSMLDLGSLRALDLLDWTFPYNSSLSLPHALISRCTSLNSLTCVYGLPSQAISRCRFTCPTLRLLYFHGRRSPWFQGFSDLKELADAMSSPLTSSVRQVIGDLSVTEYGGYCEQIPSDDEAWSCVKEALATLDWGSLDSFARRLQSLTIHLSLEIGHSVTEDQNHWRSMAEELILGQLPLRVREVLRLHIHVSRSTPELLTSFVV